MSVSLTTPTSGNPCGYTTVQRPQGQLPVYHADVPAIACKSSQDTLVAKMIGILNHRKQAAQPGIFAGYIAKNCLLQTKDIRGTTVEDVLLKADKAVIMRVVMAAYRATYPKVKAEQKTHQDVLARVKAAVEKMEPTKLTVDTSGQNPVATIHRDPKVMEAIAHVGVWITTEAQRTKMFNEVPCTETVSLKAHFGQTLTDLQGRFLYSTETFGSK